MFPFDCCIDIVLIIFKASSDENEEQITELTGAVEELRKMLKDSSEGEFSTLYILRFLSMAPCMMP